MRERKREGKGREEERRREGGEGEERRRENRCPLRRGYVEDEQLERVSD